MTLAISERRYCKNPHSFSRKSARNAREKARGKPELRLGPDATLRTLVYSGEASFFSWPNLSPLSFVNIRYDLKQGKHAAIRPMNKTRSQKAKEAQEKLSKHLFCLKN